MGLKQNSFVLDCWFSGIQAYLDVNQRARNLLAPSQTRLKAEILHLQSLYRVTSPVFIYQGLFPQICTMRQGGDN